jgi:hypothetical protein
MRRLMTWVTAAVVPALLVSALSIGCSGSNTEAPTSTEKKTGKSGKGGKPKLTKFASTGTATLKGKVTIDGEPAEIETLNKQVDKLVSESQNKDQCLAAPADEKGQQKWKINKDDTVRDVFVWVAPPEGQYFDVDMNKKSWPEKVVIDQPHCAFVPHAAVLFPGAYNPDKPDEPRSSGQKFIVKNSASFNHNTAWTGGENKILPAGKEEPVELEPSDDPVILHCDIHKWMDGVVRVYNHPYAAVTNEKGEYEIKDVPVGDGLRIFVWHEEGKYATDEKGDKLTLKAGDTTTKDFKFKSK